MVGLRWWLSRRRQKRYADAHGYFWKPCPRCGISFGGHEWRTAHEIPKGDGTAQNWGICPPCAYQIGKAFDQICKVDGHEFTEVWKPVNPSIEHAEGRTILHGIFHPEMPPSEVVCSRCYLEFDPLTREPIGRPLW